VNKQYNNKIEHRSCAFLKRFFLLWFIVSSNIVLADSNDSVYYSVEAKYHYGIFIPHHSDYIYQVKDYIQGGEVNVIRTRYRHGVWENSFNRIEFGFGMWYGSFGNDDVFGRGIALYPFLNLQLFQLGKLSAKARLAFGGGFVNRPFDINNNPFNTVFGSHITAYGGLGLMVHYPVTNRITLTGGMAINHFSNGSTRKPNNGANTASVSAGVRYNLTPAPETLPQKIKMAALSKRELLLLFSAGRNQAAHYNPKMYWSGSLTATYLWHINRNVALGTGVDFIKYGGAPYSHIRYQHIDPQASYGLRDELFMGTFGTAEFHFGTTAIYFSPSVYLYTGTTPPQPYYARMGLRQKVYKNIVAHMGIKASFFTAEFIEFGIGYRFMLKQN
jgi:hypothetical protein